MPKKQKLTKHDFNVLVLMCKGMSNKAICRKLHLSEQTVKNATHAIYSYSRTPSWANARVWTVIHAKEIAGVDDG